MSRIMGRAVAAVALRVSVLIQERGDCSEQ